jgi:hypothetical protein
VVLGLAIGWAVEAFAGLRGALLLGVLAGMVAANFVPLSTGCPTGQR